MATRCPGCGATLGTLALGPEHRGTLTECVHCGHAVRSRSTRCPSCGENDPARKKRISAPVSLPTRRGLAVPAVVVVGVLVVVGWTRLAVARFPAKTVEQRAKIDSVVIQPIGPEKPALKVETRWTSNWANVRLHPSHASSVLEELPPGTRVDATRDSSGWWFVYVYGDSLGYVAGSLLSAHPPDSLQTAN